MAQRWERAAALRPGPSMLTVLPGEWLVAPGDAGNWWLLGGALAGDPDVVITVEHASADGRDVGESMAWLMGELLSAVTGGQVQGVTLSDEECASLHSQLRMMLRTGRDV